MVKAAGVAGSTNNVYFPGKKTLPIAPFEKNLSPLFDVLERALALLETPREQLLRIVELQLGWLDKERGLAELLTVNLRPLQPGDA